MLNEVVFINLHSYVTKFDMYLFRYIISVTFYYFLYVLLSLFSIIKEIVGLNRRSCLYQDYCIYLAIDNSIVRSQSRLGLVRSYSSLSHKLLLFLLLHSNFKFPFAMRINQYNWLNISMPDLLYWICKLCTTVLMMF